MSSRWSKICAALPLVVAMSAASSEPIAKATANRSGTAAAKGELSSSRDAPSTPFPMAPENLRMVIAAFLESQAPFRKYDDQAAPKLVNARFAGPAPVLYGSNRKQPIYCIQVDLIMTNPVFLATVDQLEARITFPPPENGGPRIQGQVWSIRGTGMSSKTCNNVPFTPFPELEQLRAKRRRALGKSDS